MARPNTWCWVKRGVSSVWMLLVVVFICTTLASAQVDRETKRTDDSADASIFPSVIFNNFKCSDIFPERVTVEVSTFSSTSYQATETCTCPEDTPECVGVTTEYSIDLTPSQGCPVVTVQSHDANMVAAVVRLCSVEEAGNPSNHIDLGNLEWGLVQGASVDTIASKASDANGKDATVTEFSFHAAIPGGANLTLGFTMSTSNINEGSEDASIGARSIKWDLHTYNFPFNKAFENPLVINGTLNIYDAQNPVLEFTDKHMLHTMGGFYSWSRVASLGEKPCEMCVDTAWVETEDAPTSATFLHTVGTSSYSYVRLSASVGLGTPYDPTMISIQTGDPGNSKDIEESVTIEPVDEGKGDEMSILPVLEDKDEPVAAGEDGEKPESIPEDWRRDEMMDGIMGTGDVEAELLPGDMTKPVVDEDHVVLPPNTNKPQPGEMVAWNETDPLVPGNLTKPVDPVDEDEHVELPVNTDKPLPGEVITFTPDEGGDSANEPAPISPSPDASSLSPPPSVESAASSLHSLVLLSVGAATLLASLL